MHTARVALASGLTVLALALSLPGCGGGNASMSQDGGTCDPACSGVTPYCDAHQRCVVCLTDKDCGAGTICGTKDGEPACVKACKSDDDCPTGDACCDQRCVEVQSDPGNCGGCGFVCPAPANGKASCEASQCGLDSCNAGHKDCDQDLSNGCEAHTDSDPQNCGACGNACPGLDHGHATCIDENCAAACDPGYALCGRACLDILSDPMNCGACGHACTGATPFCNQGTCANSPVVLQVVTGKSHTCALLADGTVQCWGFNNYGELGLGSYDDNAHVKPAQVSGLVGVTQLVAGTNHICALLGDGTVQCWGSNYNGKLGYSTTANCIDTFFPCSTSPKSVSGLSGAKQITAGGNHTCALLQDSTAQCWGANNNGQLGYSTTATCDDSVACSTSPKTVVSLSGIKQIAAGSYHTCARLDDGSIRCWGSNSNGQLGDGTTASRTSPTVVPGLSQVAQLAARGDDTCARMGDGTVSCWGRNDYGQLGNGSTADALSPTLVPDLDGVAALGAGGDHVCAQLQDGGVSCWGKNDSGQVGDGTTTRRNSPTPVSGSLDAIQLSLGTNHTCAVLANGSLSCWGQNDYGQLGDGTTTSRSTPTPVVW